MYAAKNKGPDQPVSFNRMFLENVFGVQDSDQVFNSKQPGKLQR